MASETTQISLPESIQNSHLLTPEQKSFWLAHTDQLNPEQRAELSAALASVHQAWQKKEKEYAEQRSSLHDEFLKKVKSFKRKKLQRIRRAAEQLDKSRDGALEEKLLRGLDE